MRLSSYAEQNSKLYLTGCFVRHVRYGLVLLSVAFSARVPLSTVQDETRAGKSRKAIIYSIRPLSKTYVWPKEIKDQNAHYLDRRFMKKIVSRSQLVIL